MLITRWQSYIKQSEANARLASVKHHSTISSMTSSSSSSSSSSSYAWSRRPNGCFLFCITYSNYTVSQSYIQDMTTHFGLFFFPGHGVYRQCDVKDISPLSRVIITTTTNISIIIIVVISIIITTTRFYSPLSFPLLP